MALRLRRGTNAERQLITPLEGEPIFTTDTKDLYIGDGSTAGGIKVGGDIPSSINDLTDVNTAGISVGQVLKWNGTQFVAGDDDNDGTGTGTGTGIVEGQIYNISISGNDSSLIVDANRNTLRGVFEGVAYADVIGSIFSDNDSSIILDATNRILSINDIEFTNLTPTITGVNNITMTAPGGVGIEGVQFNTGSQIEPTEDNIGFVGSFAKRFAEGHFNELYAERAEGNWQGTFSGDDSGILIDGLTGRHFGTFVGELIGPVIGNVTGNITGNITGNVVGDITGNIIGNVLGDIRGSVFGDDSTPLVDAINGVLTGPVETFSVVTEQLAIRNPNVSDDLVTIDAVTLGSNGPNINFRGSRTSIDSPNPVDARDAIIDLNVSGWDGSAYTPAAVIKMGVDEGVTVSNGVVPGRILFITYNSTGGTGLDNVMVFNNQGNLGIKTGFPAEALDVNGNGVFSGSVQAAAFKGTLVADDSAIILDGTTGSLITANIDIVGTTGTPSVGAGDLANVNEWLQVTVNGNTRYIPLYA